jgi:hypothetical protein
MYIGGDFVFIKRYRQLIIGMAIGAFAMTESGASAAVGDKVEAIFADFNFIVNGKQVTPSETPLVYNGTSYLPVRSLANLTGMDVTYKSDSRTIELNNISGKAVSTPTTSDSAAVDNSEYYLLTDIAQIVRSKPNPPRFGSSVRNGKNVLIYGDSQFEVDPNSNYFYDSQSEQTYYSKNILLQFLSESDLNNLSKYSVNRASKTVTIIN